ncbi:hypothetical protein A0H81_01603 [Grifola frondosa]|uniref:Uncharacterized protein n=1 Tax=Grifola frondosa TaxID=5627 RepID=A0A1C7MNS4_GRIFR|nr:hypothetical protein A0H81_01603 [Grifola frondosa]
MSFPKYYRQCIRRNLCSPLPFPFSPVPLEELISAGSDEETKELSEQLIYASGIEKDLSEDAKINLGAVMRELLALRKEEDVLRKKLQDCKQRRLYSGSLLLKRLLKDGSEQGNKQRIRHGLHFLIFEQELLPEVHIAHPKVIDSPQKTSGYPVIMV